MKKDFFSDTEKNIHIKDYLEKNLTKYGRIEFSLAVIDRWDTDKVSLISNLPDLFAKNYLQHKSQNTDPVVISAMNRVSPFAWDETMLLNAPIVNIFDSIRSHINIVSGQTFILHGPNNTITLLTLYINKFLAPDVFNNITQNKKDIQDLLISVYEMMIHLYRACTGKSYDQYLTSREAEILHLSSTGKTYPEIATILNLTVSTVKFHMSKTIKKLGVKNAKHAIRVCTEMNISPDD